MKILKIENVNSGYEERDVLKNITSQVKKGDFIGIIGPNGAGKSTLLRTITRIIKPSKGTIYLKEKDIQEYSYKEVARCIACVRQESYIPFSYNVEDIVMMGRFPYQNMLTAHSKQDKVVVNEMLTLTDVKRFNSREILSLSSGEKQRVLIARALTQEPEILFLDEPTSHLDIGHQVQILDILKRLNQERNMTIISIMHDLNLAAEYCDKLILLDKGYLRKYDTPRKVLDYELLEEVYNTVVVVKENPISNKPYVILVSQDKYK